MSLARYEYEHVRIIPNTSRARELKEYASVMGMEALARQVDWARIPEWLRLELVQSDLNDYSNVHTS